MIVGLMDHRLNVDCYCWVYRLEHERAHRIKIGYVLGMYCGYHFSYHLESRL